MPKSPEPETRSNWSQFGGFLLRAVPAGIGGLAFVIAATTSANTTGLKDLLQFSIALIAGLAGYLVSYEVIIRRLPRLIRKDLTSLDENLTTLNSEIETLQTKLAEQLITIESLRQFQKIEFEIAAALTSARALQRKATKSVWAMWTQHAYDASLKEYFEDTLSREGIQTVRIVDALTVEIEDLIDHISVSWPHFQKGTYQIYVGNLVEFEAMVIDYCEAGLFIYSAPGYGTCYLGSDDVNFKNVVTGLFERYRRDENLLTVPHVDSPTPEAVTSIRDWLQRFYESV